MGEIVFKCDLCGYGFSLEDGKRVYIDGEPWTACPNCGSVDLEYAKTCDHCGEIVSPHERSDGLCPVCRREAKRAFRDAWDGLEEWIQVFLEESGYITIEN